MGRWRSGTKPCVHLLDLGFGDEPQVVRSVAQKAKREVLLWIGPPVRNVGDLDQGGNIETATRTPSLVGGHRDCWASFVLGGHWSGPRW